MGLGGGVDLGGGDGGELGKDEVFMNMDMGYGICGMK